MKAFRLLYKLFQDNITGVRGVNHCFVVMEGKIKVKKCYKCGNSTYYESTELYSPYGLHKLGLCQSEMKTMLRCTNCNAAFWDKEESEKRWKEHEISWEELKRRFPEILMPET